MVDKNEIRKKIYKARQEGSDLVNVSNYESRNYYERESMKSMGGLTYCISQVDAKDKFSTNYKNCTGVIIIGKDKETGEEVSFMSHQDPNYFLNNEEQFSGDLAERIDEIIERTKKGSRDALMFGGNGYIKSSYHFDDSKKGKLREDYSNSISFLSGIISKKMGFSPVVLTGPKTVGEDDWLYFSNKNRRLYMSRPDSLHHKSNDAYDPGSLKREIPKWKISKRESR